MLGATSSSEMAKAERQLLNALSPQLLRSKMIIKLKTNGGDENEVVKFGREMVEPKRVRGPDGPSKIGLDTIVQDQKFIRQRPHGDGTYVLISNYDVVDQLARLSRENAELYAQLEASDYADSRNYEEVA